MIIPVKCFTCGKVIASKWEAYKREVAALENEMKKAEKVGGVNNSKDDDELVENFEKMMRGKILDKLGVDRMCCRRHLLTHVELVDII